MSQTASTWRVSGACIGLDPGVFFPESEDDDAAEAKSVCSRCPVRVACLEHALASRERDGVWGGATARERRRIIRRRRRSA
jgi:WhiB family redox-sensing transcriptional regulator